MSCDEQSYVCNPARSISPSHIMASEFSGLLQGPRRDEALIPTRGHGEIKL